MLKENFGKLVKQVLEELPKEVLENMENVSIDIMKEPLPKEKGKEEWENDKKRKIELRANGILLGLYKGTPRIKWGKGYGNIAPSEITIFQENIEKFTETEDKILEVLKKNIFYEIARNYGFDEKRIEELKKKPAKKKSIIY